MDNTSKLKFIETIPIITPESRIYARLKYNIHHTELQVRQEQRLKSSINNAASLCNARGCWRKLPIHDNRDGVISLPGDITFHSQDLAKFLSQAHEIVIFAVTIGNQLSEQISQFIKEGNALDAIVYDAAGGEMADAAIAWLQRYVNTNLKRHGAFLSKRRFSAGYGDFGLENQEEIYRILEMEKLGIRLTAQYLMIPEKSVTAIAGVILHD